MDYVTDLVQHENLILCCQCGLQIKPNAVNMCIACLRTKVDITEDIPKQSTVYFCRNCERYLQSQNSWINASLESKELLALCLKKIKNLQKVRIIDASFVWTEPHSKRLKVKLTVQKEVLNGALLQQVFIVEFVVHNQMCESCHRVEAKDFWRAVVQVRQKTNHKKTFLFLEQLILKHQAHRSVTGLKTMPDGIDFFFQQKQDARKFVDFIQAVVPCRYKTAEELVSHDAHNNVFTYKHTFCVELVPICKNDIVCLPLKLARSLGNISQICICTRVTQSIHLIDPTDLKVTEVYGTVFWRTPFASLCTPRQLQQYIVMQIEAIDDFSAVGRSNKHVLADVWVVRASELGTGDRQYNCRTHLGHLLNVGDTVLGFDMTNSNVNDEHLDKIAQDKLPDVVLVKKLFADSSLRARKRKWKLKRIRAREDSNAMETESVDRDLNEFMEDLEEDADYRENVNIYKDASRIPVDVDESEDDEIPKISLQEMLDDLHLSDKEELEGPEHDDRDDAAA